MMATLTKPGPSADSDESNHRHDRNQGSRPMEQSPDRVLHPAKGDPLHPADYAPQAGAFR